MTKRTFRILHPDVRPSGALTWETAVQRRAVLRRWRRWVCQNFNSRRVLRIAWALYDLFNSKTGFSHAGDRYLATEVDLRVIDVQKGLTTLDRGKAIIRVHCFVDGKLQRRIFPAGIPAIAACSYLPQQTLPLRQDRYRKAERHHAAASTKEAMHRSAEAWRDPSCQDEIDPKAASTKGGREDG